MNNIDIAFVQNCLLISTRARQLDDLQAQRREQELYETLVAIKMAAGNALNMMAKAWGEE